MSQEAPQQTATPIVPRWIAALAGIVSAGVALGVAELVTAAAATFRSPVIDIGDRVIEYVPNWLKELAISLFGTNDKIALLAGIGIMLTVFAGVVGIVALRHNLRTGIAGIGLLAVLGAAAAIGSGRGPLAILPSLIGAVAGGASLYWLDKRARQHAQPATPAEPMTPDKFDRRAFLLGAGALGVGAVAIGGAGRALSSRFSAAASLEATTLPAATTTLASLPAAAGFDIPGLSPFSTPNADFYRIDTALVVPNLNTDGYKLNITGRVDNPVEMTYEDLINEELVEADITLTCVSNEVGGRLVGNARWLGVPLATLLERAGVQPDAQQIVGRSSDGYTCGFPVAAALDGREALVAVGMNGEPLPLEHGFPVRLVVPGLYGYVSATKWLTEIELTTFDELDHYWEQRGWAQEAPIKVQSRIDTPAALSNLPGDKTWIAGVAWAQTRGIVRVEIKIDDEPWRDAELAEEVATTTWRQWRMPWTPTAGRHTITVRATDGDGTVQTEERARPIPDGATGWHSVVVFGPDA